MIAKECDYAVWVFPGYGGYPDDIESVKKRGKFPGAAAIESPSTYLNRNKAMVDLADLVLVAPRRNEEEVRSGTWATARYARKIGVRTTIIER